MSYDDALKNISSEAITYIKEGYIIGLGSGRATTTLVKTLGKLIRRTGFQVVGVPSSLQIKLVAEKAEIPVIEADYVDYIDIVFDGADQIDSEKYVIKGGGGALLRENILFSLAKKVFIMADKSKFTRRFTRTVPVEIHRLARSSVITGISKLGGHATVRMASKGYPFFTENGNIILDCDFGTIKNPRTLSKQIKQMPGVLESGIFLRRPDVIYKAKTDGTFDVLSLSKNPPRSPVWTYKGE